MAISASFYDRAEALPPGFTIGGRPMVYLGTTVSNIESYMRQRAEAYASQAVAPTAPPSPPTEEVVVQPSYGTMSDEDSLPPLKNVIIVNGAQGDVKAADEVCCCCCECDREVAECALKIICCPFYVASLFCK